MSFKKIKIRNKIRGNLSKKKFKTPGNKHNTNKCLIVSRIRTFYFIYCIILLMKIRQIKFNSKMAKYLIKACYSTLIIKSTQNFISFYYHPTISLNSLQHTISCQTFKKK